MNEIKTLRKLDFLLHITCLSQTMRGGKKSPFFAKLKPLF